MDEYDVFLCDDRVAPMMPALLGNKWMQKKKLPVNVNVTRTRHLKQAIQAAIGSTRFIGNRGTCISVPLGSLTTYSPDELLENLAAALPKIASKIPYEGWKNIQNLEVKTGKSASLPVWNSDLTERWVGVPDAVPMDEDDEISQDEEMPASLPSPPASVKKSAAKKASEKASATAPAKKTKSSTQADVLGAKAATGVKPKKAAKSKGGL